MVISIINIIHDTYNYRQIGFLNEFAIITFGTITSLCQRLAGKFTFPFIKNQDENEYLIISKDKPLKRNIMKKSTPLFSLFSNIVGDPTLIKNRLISADKKNILIIKLKNLFPVGLVLIAMMPTTTSFATNYYLDSNDLNASDSGPGSITQPWQTLAPLNNYNFAAGDTISFARGSNYSGGVTLSASGTSGNPIIFNTYGSGIAPRFTNTNYTILHGNVFKITGSYIIIDGLYFYTTANAPDNEEDEDVLQVGAIFIATGANYVTIRNSEFYDTPIGVNILGQYGLITNNYFHDCSRFLSGPGWGPVGVLVGNSYIEVSYNRCENFIIVGGMWNIDGGFIEVDSRYFGNTAHDVNIHHNKSSGNCGFAEITDGGTGANINITYNISNDWQQFVFWWGGNNSKIENNTVIRTLPPNNGAGNIVFTMVYSGFTVRNNIFVVANGVQVWVEPEGVDAGFASAVKQNNIYYCTDGSTNDPSGFALGPGEIIINPQFVNFTLYDFHLASNSPAIDAGQNLSYTLDMDNTSVPGGSFPDIGAYEYIDNTSTNNTTELYLTPGVKLFPNPANNFITIELENILNNEPVEVKIIDLMGRCVYQPVNITASSLHINTSSFTSGVYIVSIIKGRELFNKKLVIRQ